MFYHRLIRFGCKIFNLFRTLYWYTFRPNTRGAKAVIEYNGNVLLVRHTYKHDRWTFPGGGVNRHENFLEAVIREMKEELSVTLSSPLEIGEYENRKEYKHDVVKVFYEKLADPTFSIDPFEIKEARWFPITSLPEYRAGRVDMIINMYKRCFSK